MLIPWGYVGAFVLGFLLCLLIVFWVVTAPPRKGQR